MRKRGFKERDYGLPNAFRLRSENGMALVLTLMILVLITVLVTEFSYGVFTTTSALNNWKESQKLSFVAKSGVTLAMKTIADLQSQTLLYRFPGRMDIPVENMLDEFTGRVVITVDDENARFNLNTLVGKNQRVNDDAYRFFQNLLDNLGLDKGIADRVVDWIDMNTEPQPGLRDSEEGAKNAPMDSVDELLLIKGINYEMYEKLLPYVTVYGDPLNVKININTAPIPVIMSIGKDAKDMQKVPQDVAERIVSARRMEPFTGIDDPRFSDAAGPCKTWFTGKVYWEPLIFRITSISEENKIKRVIECVISGQQILYWKEM